MNGLSPAASGDPIPADVHVIGAGAVGLATAAVLLRRGLSVVVIEREGPGTGTSRGNAGGIAWTDLAPLASPGIIARVPGWLLDPLGPLAIRPAYALRLMPWLLRFLAASRPSRVAAGVEALAALNATALPAWERLWAEAGIEGRIRRKGCLDIFDSERAYARAQPGYALQRAHGIEAEEVPPQEIRRLEPALGLAIRRAVLLPGWVHVDDPHAICLGLAELVRARGGRIEKAEVRGIEMAGEAPRLRLADGRALDPARVVVAAGVWSRGLARDAGDRVPLDTERGYNLTIPDPGVAVEHFLAVIGHGFVVSPLAPGLRIGGAVEFGGLAAPPDWRRVEALVAKARRLIPELKAEGGSRWMGFRPSIPDSLPVIGRSAASPRVLHAFGHGHLGLTQAAATAEIVADLIQGRDPPIDLAPFRPGRF